MPKMNVKPLEYRLPNLTLPCEEVVSVPFEEAVVPCYEASLDWCELKIGPYDSADKGVTLTLRPTKAGDFLLEQPFKAVASDMVYLLKVHVTVNPDPKTLWRELPVPEDCIYRKVDTAKESFEDGGCRLVAASRRGRSHAHVGSNRDDDFAFWADSKAGRYVVAVADGAGSARFSREGSRVAVRYAAKALAGNFPALDEVVAAGAPSKVGDILAKVALNAAHEIRRVAEAHTASHPDDAATLKDFATTLLLAVIQVATDGTLHIATFSIGDGAIAWCQEHGEGELLCAPDSGEYGGQTRFLTMASVWPKQETEWADFVRSRTFVTHRAASECGALMLMTDGVSDPFFETDEMLRDATAWRRFHAAFEKSQALAWDSPAETCAERLLAWLNFWSRGNHDDRTVALWTRRGGTHE